jgi:hypothetical protein
MAKLRSIEEQIRQAIEAGEFDNLPGAGNPLNLDSYFAAPENVRMGYQMLKDQNFVPEEVSLLREVCNLREKVLKADEGTRAKLTKELQEKELALRMILERNKTKLYS